jgi:SAM-dependent methyltransferase
VLQRARLYGHRPCYNMDGFRLLNVRLLWEGQSMKARETCFRFCWKVQSVIVPGLKYSQTIYEDVLRQHSRNIGRWLDLGCGHQLLPSWRLEQEGELVQLAQVLVGLDYDFPSLKSHKTICFRVQGDIARLPFQNNSFDLVTSNMVFEHLQEPENQLAEVGRILKPGGTLIFHTPNVLGYTALIAMLTPSFIKDRLIQFLEDRKEEDVFPTYYKINSTRAIKLAAASAGLEIRNIRLIVSGPELAMIPPLVILELVFIRILMSRLCRPFRTNIIAILQKPNNALKRTPGSGTAFPLSEAGAT